VCGGGDAVISSIVIDTCYENLIDGSHWDENGLNENLKGYENLKRNEKKSVSIKNENLKGYEKISVDF